MLVLSRKAEERVYVGNDIEVIVLEVRENRVKLGFNAPGYLPIQRGELRESLFHVLEEAKCA